MLSPGAGNGLASRARRNENTADADCLRRASAMVKIVEKRLKEGLVRRERLNACRTLQHALMA